MNKKIILQNYQKFLESVNPNLTKTFEIATTVLENPNTNLIQIVYGAIDSTPIVFISYTNNNTSRTIAIKETSIDIFDAKTKERIRHIGIDHTNMTYTDSKFLSDFKPS